MGIAAVTALPVEDGVQPAVADEDVAVAHVTVDQRAARRRIGLVLPQPAQPERQRGRRLQQLEQLLLEQVEGAGARRHVERAAVQLRRAGRRRPPRMAAKAVPKLGRRCGRPGRSRRRCAQDVAGQRVALDAAGDEERLTEPRRVGAHLVHVGHGRACALGQAQGGGLELDPEDDGAGRRVDGEHQSVPLVAIDGVEQDVAPAGADRGLHQVDGLDRPAPGLGEVAAGVSGDGVEVAAGHHGTSTAMS
ncbi:MAG: hypothetical protein R2755_31810 [Acidimicrobiales bacterium]